MSDYGDAPMHRMFKVPLEPSAIDRLAAKVDEDAAKRVREFDEFQEHWRNVERMTADMMKKLAVRPITPHQIVGPQPMTGPIGGVAFYQPMYAEKSSPLDVAAKQAMIERCAKKWSVFGS